MLLYHPITRTYNDFEKVFHYQMDGEGGRFIETDNELKVGQIIIFKGVSEYAIIVKKVWEKNGQRSFTHDTAEEVVVRGRTPRNSN